MAPLFLVLLVVGAIAFLALLAALWLVAIYNGLVRRRNEVKAAWAQIEVALKRRWDLIPNLVETVKGYAAHEKETLDRVIEARAKAVSAQGPAAVSQADGALTAALGRLFALAEAYPDLKANQNFLSLQGELANTENRISAERQAYNEAVRGYNTALELFPASLVAGMMGFSKEAFFEVGDAAERQAPKVQF